MGVGSCPSCPSSALVFFLRLEKAAEDGHPKPREPASTCEARKKLLASDQLSADHVAISRVNLWKSDGSSLSACLSNKNE